MIVSQYHYICFWLDPGENSESADKATEFLFKSAFPAMESFSFNIEKGGIVEGFNPENLDEEIISHKWLLKCLDKIKAKYKAFDIKVVEDDERKKASHRQGAFEPVIIWEFDIPHKNEPSKFVLEIRIGLDVVAFRWFFSKETQFDRIKALINNNQNIENFEINFSGELFFSKFLQIVGKQDDLKKLYLLNKNHSVQDFDKYTISWQIDQDAFRDDISHYTGQFLCHHRPIFELKPDEKKNFERQRYESSEFLDILYIMMINVKKIDYEYEIAFSEFKRYMSEYDNIESDMLRIKERQEGIFAPSLSHNEYIRIKRNNVEINRYRLNFNNLVSTCIVNRDFFEKRRQRYLSTDDLWSRESSNKLVEFIGNLRIFQMRLSNRAQIIQDDIKILLDIGTREVSLQYANELLTFNDTKRELEEVENENFIPLIISTKEYNAKNSKYEAVWVIPVDEKEYDRDLFEIYRPLKVRREKFDSLKQHYLEALYQIPEGKLEKLLNGVLEKKGEIHISNKSSPGESLKLSIGKLLTEENKPVNKTKNSLNNILKEIGCDIEVGGPCQVKPVSSEFNQNNDLWVSLKSLICFLDAILDLIDNPKHHESILKNMTYSCMKRKFLFISGLLCIKSREYLKANEKFLQAVKLALDEQEFDWAFTVSQIAGLCERCEKSQFKVLNSKATEGKDLFSTQHTYEYIELYDLPRAVSVINVSQQKKISNISSTSKRIRWWLSGMSLFVLLSLIGSSFLLFVNKGSTSFGTSILVMSSWFLALIGAPLALLIGAHGSLKKLFPSILYPRILAPLAIVVFSFSFSGQLIVSLFVYKGLLTIILVGIGCAVLSVLPLQHIFKKFAGESHERRGRVMDILSLSFLEASAISSLCILIFEQTFSKIDPVFRTVKLFNIKVSISPLYMLLTSIVAVFIGVVVEKYFTPTESGSLVK